MLDENATSKLGVGKNMVTSINYWMKAFHIKEEEGNGLTELANRLLGENGWDPFLEDLGTLWLLQYFLVSKEFASIYSLVFKEFRKKHLSSRFTIGQLEADIKKMLIRANAQYSESTIQTDVKVFLRNYFAETSNKRDFEDSLASVLIDLNLLSKLESGKEEVFKLNVTERTEIPTEIFLFTILDQFTKATPLNPSLLAYDEDISVSFDDIQTQVADCFACNREGLEKHIGIIQEKYKWVVYKDDFGRKEIQIKSSRPNKWQILNAYYG